MITLFFTKKSKKLTLVEERLKEMALGYKVKQKNKIKSITLHDGDKRYIGITAINKYLDEVQGELHSWWYCDC